MDCTRMGRSVATATSQCLPDSGLSAGWGAAALLMPLSTQCGHLRRTRRRYDATSCCGRAAASTDR